MVVERYMTPNPITVDPNTSLRKAQELFRGHQIRHLPVVEDGRLVGIITDRDLRQLLPSSLAPPAEVAQFQAALAQVKVGEVMTRPVLTVTPETRTHRAARLMVERRLGCLPVLRGSILIGIITTADLLRAMAGRNEKEAPIARQTGTEGRKPARDRRSPRAGARRGR